MGREVATYVIRMSLRKLTLDHNSKLPIKVLVYLNGNIEYLINHFFSFAYSSSIFTTRFLVSAAAAVWEVYSGSSVEQAVTSEVT
jgi:hypothetical protein